MTRPDITITSTVWVNINTLLNIPTTTTLTITNKGEQSLYLYEGNTAPDITSFDGELLSDWAGRYPRATIEGSDEALWVRTRLFDTKILVQELN